MTDCSPAELRQPRNLSTTAMPRSTHNSFTTHPGTVTAASAWDAPAERKTVRPSLPESWERALRPLEPDSRWEGGEMPETYPFAV